MNIKSNNNDTANQSQNKAVISKRSSVLVWVLKIAIVLALLTVVLSSYIRLTESAVGCEPWPSCYGEYHTNESVQGINVLMNKGESSPYQVERISHRLVASSLGLVILLLFILSLLPSYRQHIGRLVPAYLMIVTVILALIGPFKPEQPLPILILGNFIGGLLIVALLYHLYRLLTANEKTPIKTPMRSPLKLGILIILIQIFWGGWTSANFSGASCEMIFDCQLLEQKDSNLFAAFNPFSSLSLEQGYKVVAEEKMQTIQLIHHIIAIFSLVYFIIITSKLMRAKERVERQLGKVCFLILSLLVAQILLGISSLFFSLHIVVVLTHNLLSALLVLVITSLNIKLSMRTSL